MLSPEFVEIINVTAATLGVTPFALVVGGGTALLGCACWVLKDII